MYELYIQRQRDELNIRRTNLQEKKNTICAGQVEPRPVALTVGAALQTGPSDRCPLQVGLDASFQAHVLLLHGVESVAHRVHHLHHVDLAVGQQLQHTHTREKRECTFMFMNNVLVPNVYQTIQYVYLAVGIVLNSQEATHACAGPNLRGRSRHWHILLVIFFCAWVASGRNVNEQNDLFHETRKTFLSQPKQQGKYMISSSPSAVYQSAFVSPPVINNHIISFQTPLWELC